MVEVKENRTKLAGRIVARRPHPKLGGYDLVTLEVDQVESVSHLPSLLNVHPGERVEVAIRSQLLGPAGAGARLHCRAKFTLDGPMCEPHPEVDDFSIS